MSLDIDYKYHFSDIKRRYQESQRMLVVRTKQRDSARDGYRMLSAVLLPLTTINVVIFIMSFSLSLNGEQLVATAVVCSLFSSFMTHIYMYGKQTDKHNRLVEERNSYYQQTVYLEGCLERLQNQKSGGGSNEH